MSGYRRLQCEGLPCLPSTGRLKTPERQGGLLMDRSADRNAGKPNQDLPIVAGNGLIDRRALLGRGVVLAGAMGAGMAPSAAAAEPLADDPWSLEIGEATPTYQMRSKFEGKVVRTLSNPDNEPR